MCVSPWYRSTDPRGRAHPSTRSEANNTMSGDKSSHSIEIENDGHISVKKDTTVPPSDKLAIRPAVFTRVLHLIEIADDHDVAEEDGHFILG